MSSDNNATEAAAYAVGGAAAGAGVAATVGGMGLAIGRVSASNFVLFDTDKKYKALIFSQISTQNRTI